MNKLFIAFVTYCLFQFMVFIPFTQAQTAVDTSIEMADSIRSDGKIYVVVLVVLIAFTGLMIYAISTDRKLSRLEKEIKSLKSA